MKVSHAAILVLSVSVASRSEAVITESPNGMQGTQNGLNGTQNGLNGTPNGLNGTPNGANGTPNGAHGTPNGMSGTPNGAWINFGAGQWVLRPGAQGDNDGLVWMFTAHGREALSTVYTQQHKLLSVMQLCPLFTNPTVMQTFAQKGLSAFRTNATLNETLFEDGLTAQVLHYLAAAGLKTSYTIYSLKDPAQSVTFTGALGLAHDFMVGKAPLDRNTGRLLMAYFAASLNDRANVLLSQRADSPVYGYTPFDYLGVASIPGLPQQKGTKSLTLSSRVSCSTADGAPNEDCGFDAERSMVFRVLESSPIAGQPTTLFLDGPSTARARLCFGANMCDHNASTKRSEAFASGAQFADVKPGLYTLQWTSGNVRMQSNTRVSFAEAKLFPLLEGAYTDASVNGILASSETGFEWVAVAPRAVQDCRAKYVRNNLRDTGIDFFTPLGEPCTPVPLTLQELGLRMYVAAEYGTQMQAYYADRSCMKDAATGTGVFCKYAYGGPANQFCTAPTVRITGTGFNVITSCQGFPAIASYVSDWCDQLIVGDFKETTSTAIEGTVNALSISFFNAEYCIPDGPARFKLVNTGQ